MAPDAKHTSVAALSQSELEDLLHEHLRQAVRFVLVTVLEAEVEAFIGAARYERGASRRDQRNGYYHRSLGTTMGQIDDLPVPRTRQGFRTHLFERYQRRRAELDAAISDMFIRGVSTRGVGHGVEHLTGTPPSASTVSRVFHTLEAEYEAWKTRPLAARYEYAFADGTYFTVIYDHDGCKMPILAVVGVRPDGVREVLGFRVGDRENQTAWEDTLTDLQERGVQAVGVWITDGNQAMLHALAVKFKATPRQRCIKHKMENVLSYIPHKQREVVYPDLKAIFYQASRAQAEQTLEAFCLKYKPLYPTAIECLKRDVEACLTFYDFPPSHWKVIRTTNVIERLFEEVKRRSHKMGAAFRNEDSCLLMFYAVIRSLKFQNLSMPS